MRKFLLPLIALLLLVGCQPRVTTMLNERFGHEGVSLSLTVNEEGYVVLNLAHEGVDLVDPSIAIRGNGVRYNSDDCYAVEGGIDCLPGEPVVVNGESFKVLSGDAGDYTLFLLGEDILANASFYVFVGDAVGVRPFTQTASVGE